MDKDSSYWLRKLATLKVDRARGDPAPHKPLLLLVVMEMAERGEIAAPEITLSPDLAFRFCVYWSIVAGRRTQRPDVRLPFHHLKSSGIWQPVMANRSPSPDKKLTVGVVLAPSFYNCLQDSTFRNKARRVLIGDSPCFHREERLALCSMLKIDPGDVEKVQDAVGSYEIHVQRGREARFRIEVVHVAYKHTCALTGYRMTTMDMESIVDAAHIHEFKDSHNNDPRNGIALSKNAHWQFDRGLWSIADDYRVIVNKEGFVEKGIAGQQLADFEGHCLFLPEDPKYWPNRKYLAWHRNQYGY